MMMTRTEKWAAKREQIKKEGELELLKSIKAACRSNKTCEDCRYAYIKHALKNIIICTLSGLPSEWSIKESN